MSRELPPRANLEHLKKQAKDLLEAHKRAEPEALGRIRDAVPAFRGKSDEEIARAPFALHDAQSAIAREYGQKSWNDLRAAVAAQAAGADHPGLSDDLLRALMPLPFPAEVGAVMRDVASRERKAVRKDAALTLTAVKSGYRSSQKTYPSLPGAAQEVCVAPTLR